MHLNIPETRQKYLVKRLENGNELVAADLALEFDISTDTVRRDIIALEAAGLAHRVRGGAVAVAKPAESLIARLSTQPAPGVSAIAQAAADHLSPFLTILMDGGTTALETTRRLPPLPRRLIITPSPWVAVTAQENSIAVYLIGGQLNPAGGVATGIDARAQLNDLAAEICVLGTCAIDPEFGLSSDELAESQLKQAMAHASPLNMVLADSSKLNKRARHRTLGLNGVDMLVTDAGPQDVPLFAADYIEVIHV